jgi:hypothetical protein
MEFEGFLEKPRKPKGKDEESGSSDSEHSLSPMQLFSPMGYGNHNKMAGLLESMGSCGWISLSTCLFSLFLAKLIIKYCESLVYARY